MGDFVQTMKDWRRMCNTLGGINCDGCKLHIEGDNCVAVYEGEMDYAKVEKVVTAWAKENPAPIYPTWREFIEDVTGILMIDVVDDPIPADIAEKLGIEPKEG